MKVTLENWSNRRFSCVIENQQTSDHNTHAYKWACIEKYFALLKSKHSLVEYCIIFGVNIQFNMSSPTYISFEMCILCCQNMLDALNFGFVAKNLCHPTRPNVRWSHQELFAFVSRCLHPILYMRDTHTEIVWIKSKIKPTVNHAAKEFFHTKLLSSLSLRRSIYPISLPVFQSLSLSLSLIHIFLKI